MASSIFALSTIKATEKTSRYVHTMEEPDSVLIKMNNAQYLTDIFDSDKIDTFRMGCGYEV